MVVFPCPLTTWQSNRILKIQPERIQLSKGTFKVSINKTDTGWTVEWDQKENRVHIPKTLILCVQRMIVQYKLSENSVGGANLEKEALI